MKICIIIPAHNEADFIGLTLQSLAEQSLQPMKIIVVDDQSSDGTASVVKNYSQKYPFIDLIENTSSEEHLPGSKVIRAFQKGFLALEEDFDVICKFDADLIFPSNYLEKISAIYRQNPSAGMVGGFCEIDKSEGWKLEDLTGKDHIRGALKSYRRACFESIGGLKPSMGWDTVDELLAQYHNWQVVTDPSLRVKHLRPTGFTYNKAAKYKQGEAFYKLRYGLLITAIASVKLALKKKKPLLVMDYISGYFKARGQKMPFLVTKKEGAFIRKLRYKKMFKKLF